ncbi:MAG: S-layer homology domain-containing protein, partial [Ruminiclostridium sp.]|nr:S-layer homology domain-containing protein [Ruminiclostridium sp.]
MKKRILGLGLSLVMALSLLPFSALGADITFTDVPVNAWYYNDVKRSVELNLVNGIGNNKFDPTGKLTYGAAVKLAACIHQQKTQGSVTLKNGSPWYQSYVDYCKSKGIITKDYNWNANATRAGYMEIFESVLPASPNDEINYVPYDSIPDVPADHPQRYSIYRLYRLGVVQGGDAQFNCSPNSDISRSEVATILVRMMDPTARKRFNTRTPLNIAKDIPTSVTVTRGQPVTLTTEACGGVTPYQYEWEYWNSRGQYYSFGGRTCFGPTVELYATEYGLDMNGHCVVSYSGWEKDIRVQCRVFDSQGSYVTTSAAVLKITGSASTTPLTISQQPNDCTVTAGSTASFYASAKNGESPYTFQWYLANGTKLTDGNGYSGT